jgi:hypothetical protein
MPLRFMNVPNNVRQKVAMISAMFQILSMPRRCWIRIECRKAVPVSQGSRATFSTGSQAQ